MSNYHVMREHMMNLVTQLAEVDIAQAPNYKVMVALSKRLQHLGVCATTAEALVAGMKINVSERASQDTELVDHVVMTYAQLIVRMLDVISQDFETDAHVVLLSMADQFNIEMDF